jgi:FG-GAP-like repeat
MVPNRLRTAAAVTAAAIVATIAVPTAATAGTRPMSGSGFLDIVAQHQDGELWAWSNINGFNQPTFPYTPWKFGAGWFNIGGVKFADLDGDTYDDLISVDTNGDVRVFRNVNGLFPGVGVKVGQGWPVADRVHFADIDGDGRDEIIAMQASGELWAWHNRLGIDPDTYAVSPFQIGRGWIRGRTTSGSQTSVATVAMNSSRWTSTATSGHGTTSMVATPLGCTRSDRAGTTTTRPRFISVTSTTTGASTSSRWPTMCALGATSTACSPAAR